jgi:hypothetical protein
MRTNITLNAACRRISPGVVEISTATSVIFVRAGAGAGAGNSVIAAPAPGMTSVMRAPG